MRRSFVRFAGRSSEMLGTPYAFLLAVATVLGWALVGPVFGFSATWQLVINTATTVVTFVMVFLLQASQNEDTRRIMEKLDKLMADVPEVGNELVGEGTAKPLGTR